MKCKLYLRMVLAAMTALFVATGCSKSTDDPDPVGPVDVPVTFELEVTNVGTGEATVAVKPSKATASYYCDVLEKSKVDAFGSDDAFLAAELKRLEGLATEEKMTLKAYLEANSYRGERNITLETTVPETPHYAFVYGIKTDGTITSKVFKAEFTSGEQPIVPVVTLSMEAGNGQGANKSSQMLVSMAVTESPAVSGKYGLWATAGLAADIAAGMTWEQLIDREGDRGGSVFSDDYLKTLNGETGLGLIFGTAANPLPANTSFTAIIKVVDAKGNVVVMHEEASTEPGGGGTGPELTLKMTPGDKNGANTDTWMTLGVKTSGATAAKYLFTDKAQVDKFLAQGVTIEQLIEANGYAIEGDGLTLINSANGGTLSFDNCTPGTAYTSIIRVVNASGVTVKAVSGTTTGGGGGGEGPALTMNMYAGDSKGQNKSTAVTIECQSSAAVSASYYLGTTANVDNLISKGETYESLATKGSAFLAAWITTLNSSAGLPLEYTKCKPGESWTMILKVTGADGSSTVKHASATTDSNAEPPTTVEAKNLSHGELHYWGQPFEGAESVNYSDWEIRIADASFNFATGGTGEYLMIELIAAKSATSDITPGTYTVCSGLSMENLVAFNCMPGSVVEQGGKYYMQSTWYSNLTSPTTGVQWPVSGGTVKISKSGSNYTIQLDFSSAEGNANIKGTYTGTLKFVDKTRSSSQTASKGNTANGLYKSMISREIFSKVDNVSIELSSLTPTSAASNGLEVRSFKAEMSAGAFEPASKSSEAVYKAILLE